MITKTLHRQALILCLGLFLIATPAASVTFDYTTIWSHLSDRIVPHFLYDCGGLADVAVKGNIAYTIDDYNGLQVVDCTDPQDFSYRGFVSIPNAFLRRCDVWNHYVYVIDDQTRITVIDVDEHDNPVQVNQLTVGVSVEDILVTGPWLYVSLGNNTLQIYSLAEAHSPTLAGTIALSSQYTRRLILDNGLIVGAGNGGLVIIDPTMPSWPSVLGSFDFDGNTWDLSAHNGLAVVGQTDQSRLLDFTDPDNIFETALMDDPGHGVLLTSNNQMWLGREYCWHQGATRIYDVSDPATPVWLHDEFEGFRGAPRAMVEYQGYIYAAEHMCWCAGEWPGFHIFSVGDLPLPEPLDTASYTGGYGILSHGSRIDLATNEGMVSLDVSDPYDFQTMQVLDPGNDFWYPVEDEGTIVAFGSSNTSPVWLQVMSRDAQGNLESRGSLDLENYLRALALDGTLALVGFREDGGALAIDVSNLDSPEIITELFVGEDVMSIALHGDLAAVWMAGSTHLYDLSNLADPLLLSTMGGGYQWYSQNYKFVERSGRLLLLVSETEYDFDYNGGLAKVYDITEPTDPVCLLSLRQLGFDMPGPLVLDGHTLIVPGSRQLTFYDWPDLDGPAEFKGRLQYPADAAGFWGSRAMVTDQAIVIQHHDGTVGSWPLPEGMLSGVPEDDSMPHPKNLMVSSHPNPFNPSCEIRFTMPEDAEVSVEIYDLQGRRVRSILNANAYAGHHSVRWDGRNGDGQMVAAGVYLARVKAGMFATSTKLTLTK